MAAALRTVWLRGLVALLSSGLILSPAAAQDHHRAPVPGAVDPHVTQATIYDTICHRGYTARVRPPRPVTDAIKHELAERLPDAPHDYELDHLIPLGLGGHPTSPNNLWLQARSSSGPCRCPCWPNRSPSPSCEGRCAGSSTDPEAEPGHVQGL